MLQIVQGMYFRDVPLTDTLHRGILYTNLRAFGDRQAHSLLFGRLLPSTTFHGVGSLTIEAREQLETLTESGRQDALVATSGDQLIDEIAAVMAFCLNVVCVRDHETARRLISRQDETTQQMRGPASILRQTFDAMVVLRGQSIEDFDAFLHALTALQRKCYEAAIRAIRQVVDATLMVDEDATLAYTLMVAALESLGQATEPEPSSWLEYDQQKRERIDQATKGLSQKRKDQIRAAVMTNEHRALQRRFVAFVLNHVEPSFYRREAVGAVRPIAATELPAALRQAYAIRSRNVHALENLAPEVWMAADRADTADVEDNILLSLEGLARLARHVVRRFVARAPKGKDASFNYRSALPGIIRARWAAQYWIHQAAGFDRRSAPAFLDGMIEFLIEGMSKRSEAGLVDMTAVLEKIEKTALSLSKQSDRLPMAGIMALWNACAPEEKRRTLKPKLKAKFENDLSDASIVSFAVKLLLGHELPWSPEALQALATERRTVRLENNLLPMPKRIDAALHIVVADQLLARGDKVAGLAELALAVETVPGLTDLIKFEEAIARGEDPVLNLRRFVLVEQEFVDWKVSDDDTPPTVSDDELTAKS